MDKKGKQWLIGCGAFGCGAVVLAIGLAIAGGTIFMRDTMSGFETALESRAGLEERFGDMDDFTPSPDGAVPPGRMQAFLAVRDALAPERERLAETFGALPMDPEKARELEEQTGMEKARSVFKITRSAFGLGAGMGDFFAARNHALLDQGMGMGEYTYVYVLAYHVWLGHESDRELESMRLDVSSSRVRKNLLDMLRNQLAALPESAEESWRQALAAEVEAMESQPRRLPWAEGLPAPITASLEPYRERLEATFDPLTDALELARTQRRGRWSVEAD